jgi:hypothetical protein
MEQLNQIIIYAFLCGAGVFIGILGWRREVDTAWIVSLVSAAAVVWFVFPDPTPVDRIVDAIDNITLIMYKVGWSVAWFVGSLGVYFVVRYD